MTRRGWDRLGPRDSTLETKSKLLWVGDAPAPRNVHVAVKDRWDLVPYCRDEPLGPQLSELGLAAGYPNGSADDPSRLGHFLDQLERTAAVAVFLLPKEARAAWDLLTRRPGQHLCIKATASSREIRAQFQAAATLQPAIENLQSELSAARTILSSGPRSFEELDEEMRLAARLQRDFLPRRLPEVGGIRFGVMYRPASWVSQGASSGAAPETTKVAPDCRALAQACP